MSEAGPFRLPAVAGDDELTCLLRRRRSTKSYDAARAISLDDLTALLWSAAGTTTHPHRVSASARAAYPVEVTAVADRVEGLAAGAYAYLAEAHALDRRRPGHHILSLASATLDAERWLGACPAVLLLSADLAAARTRLPDQPPEHGERFAWLEAGLATQNLHLAAQRRGLGSCLVAGLDDAATAAATQGVITEGHSVLGILALGKASPADGPP